MSEPTADHLPEEPATIVWWPWFVLAAGPAVAAVLAIIDDDPPTDGGEGFFALVVVAALALLFLAALFTPSLLVISRNAHAPRSARERAVIVFVACVAGAHLVGQLIDRAGPDSGDSSIWAFAFIGTYLAASAFAYVALRSTFGETSAPRGA
jgi:uncharacterized membrane protein YhaH (DUF805 family)